MEARQRLEIIEGEWARERDALVELLMAGAEIETEA